MTTALKGAKFGLFAALLTLFMTLVFLFNFIDSGNTAFESFQKDSEQLADSSFFAGANGLEFPSGLGKIESLQFGDAGLEGFEHGFSVDGPQINYANNYYTQKYLQAGCYLQLTDGSKLLIEEVDTVDEKNIIVTLAAHGSLANDQNRAIEHHVLLDSQGEPLPFAAFFPYLSQFGLQGKAYYCYAKLFPDGYDILPVLCAFFTALTLTAICLAVCAKYNNRLGMCFYVVFLLSPWIVNFSRNLYWVPFTWFLPMLVGLLCPTSTRRYLFYGLGFLAIFARCLCGYEYISAIMLFLIVFPLAECIIAKGPDKKIHFQNVVFLSLSALSGFALAIFVHALSLRKGSFMNGLSLILGVVKRRTTGPSGSVEADAAVGEVLARYFRFDTQIITGLDGSLFVLLVLLSAGILLYQIFKKEAVDKRVYVLYAVSFLAPVSWFVLAKGHSFYHYHMNYVLWYFGFVQMCLYVICSFLLRYLRSPAERQK